MKRTEINKYINDARVFLKEHQFALPPFADWNPKMWMSLLTNPHTRKELSNIMERSLGWDVTDRGQGRYRDLGLLLFTLRNGKSNTIRDYAEKILIVGENQVTPWHYHWKKCEDVINRAGGVLIIEFQGKPEKDIGPHDDWCQGNFGSSSIPIIVNDIEKMVEPGFKLELLPGESCTVFNNVYHKFYGKNGHGTVLVGEVSKVNDDYYDSRFKDNLVRFPKIEEDEEPQYVLCNEYSSLRNSLDI